MGPCRVVNRPIMTWSQSNGLVCCEIFVTIAFVVHWRRVFLISTRHIERIRGASCDDALYKLTFTFTLICCTHHTSHDTHCLIWDLYASTTNEQFFFVFTQSLFSLSILTLSPLYHSVSACHLISRAVLNIFFISVWFRFGLNNSVSVRNEFGPVRFKKRYGSDIILICYSCNSWVVNLQQILQRQWMTWLWRHSQQRQQVNNVITF